MAEDTKTADTQEKMTIEEMPSLLIDGLGTPITDSGDASDEIELPGATEEPVTEEGNSEGENVRDGYDPTYWQSEYDKQKAEMDRIKGEYEKLSTIKSELEGNPELVNHLKKFYESKDNVQTQPVAQTQDALPPKPLNYNGFEAIDDPNSESYKWRESVERIKEQQMVSRATTAAQKAMADAIRMEQQKRAEMQQKAEFDRQRQEFLARRNVDEGTFEKFMQDINSPNATLDDLYDFWNMKNQKTRVETNAKQSIAQQINRTQNTPSGLANVQSDPRPEPNENDLLWDSILREGNKGIVNF